MNKQRHYLPSIDGLRALAIIFVLLYHFQIPFFSGGFIGVDIFFVLSGYLITSKLLIEWQKNKNINLKKFWLKRIRRLMPAVIFLIVSVLIICLIGFPAVFHKSWKDGVASFFYVSNWWYIFEKIPYFDSFGIPSPFKHLWSLAIEEQFYVFWPLIFVILIKWLKKRQHVLKYLVIVGWISAILMALLYSPSHLDRVYYGTDTRLFTLAVGCSLAFLWPYTILEDNISREEQIIIDFIGLISLIILILMAISLSETTTFLYYGGFLMIALLAALLLAVLVHPGSRMAVLFSNKYAVWIGKRSYSMYLWHYPIIALTTPVKGMGRLHPSLIILQLILIIFISHWSYTYLEEPIRKYGFTPYLKKITNTKVIKAHTKNIAISIVLLLLLSSALWVNSDYINNGKFFFQEVKHDKIKVEKVKKDIPKKDISRVLAIGDSVLLGAQNQLAEAIPGIVIDAEVGRQLYQAHDLVEKKYKKYNNEDAVIILELGSNSPFKVEQLTDFLALFNRANILIVNTRVPKPWEAEVNQMLAEVSETHQNIKLADWHSEAIQAPYLLVSDGVHLSLDGIVSYTNLIMNNLSTYNLKPVAAHKTVKSAYPPKEEVTDNQTDNQSE